jgi:hypothetical protein
MLTHSQAGSASSYDGIGRWMTATLEYAYTLLEGGPDATGKIEFKLELKEE